MTDITTKKKLFSLLVIFIVLFSFRECNNKHILDIASKQYKKSADSSRVESEKLILKVEKAEMSVVVLKKDLKQAKLTTEISEGKLRKLQRKTEKPEYVKDISDCNDTIQSVYAYSIKKDSACNIVISNKDKEIFAQDTIIKSQEIQKQDLLLANELKENANKNLEQIIVNDKKQLKQEKGKKNIWKTTSVGLALVVLKMIIFK